jgi:hypothetical protein
MIGASKTGVLAYHVEPASSGGFNVLQQVTVVLVLVGFVSLMPGPTAQQPAGGPRALVGTWTLASAQRLSATGDATTIPSPRGLLVFDAAGHVFDTMTRGGRPLNAAGQATPAEAHATYDSYQGLWGRYRLDGAPGSMTIQVAGSVNPNLMGQEVVRGYEMKGDRLIVTSAAKEPNAPGGMRWTWQRIPEVENLSAAHRRLVGFWQHVVEKRVNATTDAVTSETTRAPSLIVYTPSGYVGVHFPPLNRKRFAGETPTDDEARAAIGGYVGYFGVYTLYPGAVFHHRLAILTPGQTGDTLQRFFEISGDQITLRFPPGVTQQGQEQRTIVILKRLSGEAAMLPAS